MGRSGTDTAPNLTAAWRRAGTGVAAGILLLAAAACGGSGETETPVPATNADRTTPAVSTTVAPLATTAVTTTRPVAATATAATADSSSTVAAPATSAPPTTLPPTTAPTTTAPTTAASTATAGPPSGTIIELEITDGKLEGGARREAAPLGEEVTVRVSGDSADHVHVHGYDLFLHLEDGAGELTFVADIPGVFEIELEEAGIVLVQLEVS